MIDIADLRYSWGLPAGEVSPDERGPRGDLARALNEIERLRELVKKAYFEADSTYWPDANWHYSKSKAALEGKDE